MFYKGSVCICEAVLQFLINPPEARKVPTLSRQSRLHPSLCPIPAGALGPGRLLPVHGETHGRLQLPGRALLRRDAGLRAAAGGGPRVRAQVRPGGSGVMLMVVLGTCHSIVASL